MKVHINGSIKEFKAKKTILTNLHVDFDYEKLKKFIFEFHDLLKYSLSPWARGNV